MAVQFDVMWPYLPYICEAGHLTKTSNAESKEITRLSFALRVA